ncbi:hypothetical protein SAMN05421636_105384 [Pricia antarctica]|uniref:Uncharacterized protein n=1 Tax=Pricia antarctica TaxID=641691 RepID=A0A1G7DLY4_9FLAO|nr:hypothetical protein SAMN05421636_105384 [Pricia antarctica]
MNLILSGEETQPLMFRKLLTSHDHDWLPFHQNPRSSEFWKGWPENPEKDCHQQFERVFEPYEKNLGGINAFLSRLL